MEEKLMDAEELMQERLANGCDVGCRTVTAMYWAGRLIGSGLEMVEVAVMLHLWDSRNRPPLGDAVLLDIVGHVARHSPRAERQ